MVNNSPGSFYSPRSFYWFDYETFGTSPVWDRPCQFAGLRTDSNLEIISDPTVLYCRQALDYLPNPGACKVTGLSPAQVNEQGMCEAEFIREVLNEIGKPGTCSVGYNSVRFDDEFTRHTAYRNFYDPYEHEWKDGNSRWDLLDVVRLTRALRPEGVNWPVKRDGSASNRLEDLSKANGIEHSHAHDALSDVFATLGMARLIKTQHPKLFNYVLRNRTKQAVSGILDTIRPAICLYVSAKISASRQHLAVVLPLVRHPQRPNHVIVLDLLHHPGELIDLTAEQIRERLYSPVEGGDGKSAAARPGLRSIATNQCPVLTSFKALRECDAMRLSIDIDAVNRHREIAHQLFDEAMIKKVTEAMELPTYADVTDPDGGLYQYGFPSSTDRQLFAEIRAAEPEHITDIASGFDKPHLLEMARRYQARNYPDSLSESQRRSWREHCQTKLRQSTGTWLTFESFEHEMNAMQWSDNELALKEDLLEYARHVWQHACGIEEDAGDAQPEPVVLC